MTTLPSALFGTTPTATTQSYYYPPQTTYPAQPVYTQPTYGQDQFSVGLNDLRNRVYQLQTQLQQAGAGVNGNAAWITAVNDLATRVAQYQQAVGNNYASPYAATLQDLTARVTQMRTQVSQPAYTTYPTYQQPTYQQPTYQQPTYQQPTYPGFQRPGYNDPIRQQRRMLRQQMHQLRQQMRQQQPYAYQPQPYGYNQQQNPLNAIVGLFQGLTNQR